MNLDSQQHKDISSINFDGLTVAITSFSNKTVAIAFQNGEVLINKIYKNKIYPLHFHATQKEIVTFKLLFNGDWLFYSDTEHKCILIDLKNITQRPILDLDEGFGDPNSKTRTETSLNNTKRSKLLNKKYRVFNIWAPRTESENETNNGPNNSSIVEREEQEADKYKLEATHVLEDTKNYETGK